MKGKGGKGGGIGNRRRGRVVGTEGRTEVRQGERRVVGWGKGEGEGEGKRKIWVNGWVNGWMNERMDG